MYLPSSPQSHPRSQLFLADDFQPYRSYRSAFKGSSLWLPPRLPLEYIGSRRAAPLTHQTTPLAHRKISTSNLATLSHSGRTSAFLTTPTCAITPNAPASPHPRQRNTRNIRYLKLFLPLLVLLQIFLLALPLTILLFIQAAVAQHPIAPTLIALVILLSFTIAAAIGVIVLCIIRRRRHKSQKRLLETEVERWKTLAREVFLEARERLRTSMRSLSRGRASVKSQEGRAETPLRDGGSLSEKIPRSTSVERRDNRKGAERSVSRGRAGKGKAGDEDREEGFGDVKIGDDIGEEMWEGSKRVGEEVWELDGQPVLINRGPSSSKLQGSMIRAKEAAQALQTLTTNSIEQKVKKMIDSHTWVKPTTWSLREVYRNKPLPPTPPRSPMLPRIISPVWGDSQILGTSPQQISPLGPLPLPSLPSLQLPDAPLSPLEIPQRSPLPLWNNSQTLNSSPMRLATTMIGPVAPLQHLEDIDSPPAKITVMDHYVAWAEMRERSRSGAATTGRDESITDHHAALREIHDSSRAGTPRDRTRGRGYPIKRPDAERSTGNVESSQDRTLQLENSSHVGRGEENECSLHKSDSYGSSGLVITRHGNGLLGRSQGDENFDHNHVLAEDATSLTSSQRAFKIALSMRKVGKWTNESAVVVAEPSSEVAAVGGIEGLGGRDLD